MILGRSTPQWLGLITAGGSLAQILLVQFLPDADPTIIATVIGAVGVFLGAFIAFLANTATTPVSDPILPAGTTVTIEDTAETVTLPTSTSTGPGGPVSG